MESAKTLKDLSEDSLRNSGGNFFVAIIDNHYYFDENIEKKKFVDGQVYYPSTTMIALGMTDSIDGMSLTYSNKNGVVTFSEYLNMSFLLSKVSDKAPDYSMQLVGKFNSYEDLPYWMSCDKLYAALEEHKELKEQELDKLIEDTGITKDKDFTKKLLKESVITTLILIIHTIFIFPIILRYQIVLHVLYMIVMSGIIVRYLIKTWRMYRFFRRVRRTK